jgi:hypothetical protein
MTLIAADETIFSSDPGGHCGGRHCDDKHGETRQHSVDDLVMAVLSPTPTAG